MSKNKWSVRIDQITHDFNHAFAQLDVQALNWKPDDKTWSIAQNIDHLIVTNESYYPLVESVRTGKYRKPFTGHIGFMVRQLGKSILQSVQADRKRKFKTFRIWEPATGNIGGDIVQRFEQHQEDLKKFISTCHDWVEKGTVVSSPANRMVVYKLETAFDIIVVIISQTDCTDHPHLTASGFQQRHFHPEHRPASSFPE